VAAPYLVFATSFLPYAGALPAIVDRVVLYGGRLSRRAVERPGGIQSFVEPALPPLVLAGLLLAGIVWAVFESRRRELTRACLLLFLVLLCLSPSWGVQYLVWPVALGALHPSAAYGVFTLAGALYHSAAPESLAIPWPLRPTPGGIWLAAAAWLVLEAVRGRREEPRAPRPESAG
jgi:hypothetical protein